MRKQIIVATACLLLFAASGSLTQGQPIVRNKNGIRLVGGSGPRGRLEVSTRDPRFPGLRKNGSVAWLPVCESGCSDQMAQTMCKLLGYSYGRKYYGPRVNYRSATSGYTAGYFTCSRTSPAASRRLLSGFSAGDALGGDVSAAAAAGAGGLVESEAGGGGAAAAATDGGGGSGRHGRTALSVARYDVDMPANAPYSCAFYFGNCEPRGPLAAIECSHVVLPPSSPPPPAPPSPPRAPLAYTESIRLVGGAANRGNVEPNLCSPSAPPELCSKYGRVELLVTFPGTSGVLLWAPLCAHNDTLRSQIARIACQQEYDWPSLRNTSAIKVSSAVPDDPAHSFTLPTGPVTSPGGFNPAGVWAWASVNTTAATTADPRTLQEFGITVSRQPCRSGSLFAVACNISRVIQ